MEKLDLEESIIKVHGKTYVKKDIFENTKAFLSKLGNPKIGCAQAAVIQPPHV